MMQIKTALTEVMQRLNAYLFFFLDTFHCHDSMAHLTHFLCFQDELTNEERLAQATTNFKSAGDSSVPVILNIFGKMLLKINMKTLQNINKLLLLNFTCALSYLLMLSPLLPGRT